MRAPRFIAALPSDRRYLPLVVVLVVVLLGLFAVLYVGNKAIAVDGPSMEPTLLNGDHVLVTRGYTVPQRGDIVSFDATIRGESDTLIKRVVALSGDTVEVFGDRVLVNGVEAVSDTKVLIGAEQFHIKPFTVPAGTVYALGDNRPVSLDSRYIGPVAISDIHGRATWIFSPITRIRRIDANPSRP